MSARKRFQYDYYQVLVPIGSGSEDTFPDQAISEARERTRLYAVPAEWSSSRIGKQGDDLVFKVRRKRAYLNPRERQQKMHTSEIEYGYNRYANGGN